jgi:hypothetical protein
LNLYGFTRITSTGPGVGGYYHTKFLRGRGDLCHHIIRKKIKGGNKEKVTDYAALQIVSEMNILPRSKIVSSKKKPSEGSSNKPSIRNQEAATNEETRTFASPVSERRFLGAMQDHFTSPVYRSSSIHTDSEVHSWNMTVLTTIPNRRF